MRSSFFSQRRKQDVCVPDRSIHFYQLTVIISDFPRFSNSASLSLSFCTSASRLLPYLIFLCTLLYLLCHIELYIQRSVFSCHPHLRQDWRIEQRRFWVYEGRRKMQTQGEGHCVKLDLLLWECEPVAVCLLTNSCNFYTRYIFLKLLAWWEVCFFQF